MNPPNVNTDNKDQKENSNPLAISTLSKGNPTESNATEIPKIELPKGGGAIKSIDEKFEVNASNGTASLSIPLPFSPGRNGQTPQIGLSYNSGGGNGVFGLGWGLGIPNIQRKTEKELPQYRDAEESDTFIFSGAEDLVPVLNGSNSGIQRYQPRIEGLFSRIERIEENGNHYWKVTSKENVVSVFGHSSSARIANPKDDSQIFRWNLEYSYDDKGNFTRYNYKQEDLSNISNRVSEKNRVNGIAPIANTYLKSILYGNKAAYYPEVGYNVPIQQDDFMFELVIDYGEHDSNTPTPNEDNVWGTRLDPYSSYRSGFETRTYRRCQRVLMFHRFDELSPNPYCVRSLELKYDENENFTYLESATQSGYIWTAGGSLKSKQSLPPMSFKYLKNAFNKEVKTISRENLHSAPNGLADNQYQWTDLYSEGLSGILSEHGDGLYYKSNNGNGEFSPATLVSPKPSYTGLGDGSLSIQELEGNGTKYLVQSGRSGGYFELNDCEGWKSFETYPNIDLNDPNLKFLDLNGDGLPDILCSKENEFLWYVGKGKLGYDDYQVAGKTTEVESGPQVLFSDANERMMIATTDMSGDGLSDIVLIQNSNVSYYPNLGYGRFGARVTMTSHGSFDHDDHFNPQYIHLADIDGSGTTDILYVAKNKIQVRYNHAGNSLSEPDEFYNPFPNIDNQSRISVIDLLGTGASCIVWSSSLPGNEGAPMRYIDITNGQKPHVMTEYYNNMGKVVNVQYKPSTHYYLEDKKKGKPWITNLPFPVQCVDKVITADRVSELRFTNEYKYHHGYYDGVEREFRGFAMTEQRDSEIFDHYVSETINGNTKSIIKEDLFQPVVNTKSWFHTGAYTCRDRYVHQLQQEYYGNELDDDTLNYILPDYKIPDDLAADEISESYRALKGLPLRQEIYSEEGDIEIHQHPYTITQFNYNIQKLQDKGNNKHAVFLSTEKEKLNFTLERNPQDPRINHSINIEIDEYGNVLSSAAIVYGKLVGDPELPSDRDRAKQKERHIIFTQNRFTEELSSNEVYRLPLLCETETFELKASDPLVDFYTSDELNYAFNNAQLKPYESVITNNEKRRIELSRILFLKDDLTGPVPFGKMESRVLPYQNYLLASTPSMIPHIYGSKVTDTMMRNVANYVRFEGDDNYWIRSGKSHFYPDVSGQLNIAFVPPATAADLVFAKKNFFMPTVFEDQVGSLTKVVYDQYRLYMKTTVDALANEINVLEYHYRTLTPWLISDPNGNRSSVRFNAMGLPISVFVLGKASETKGDKIILSSNEAHASDRPSIRMTYDWDLYELSNPNNLAPDDPLYPDIEANRVFSQAYEEHYYAEDGSVQSQTNSQKRFSYSDGSGNVVLEKVNAEPGKVNKVDATGNKITINADPRWVGSGRTILNNKGNPVKQYEPFFDDDPAYTNEESLVCQGYSPTMYYDALGRMCKKENANGTFTKIIFDAWSQTHYDENDTVLESTWYLERLTLPSSDPNHVAAIKTEVHADTPSKAYLDTLGRIFLTIDHNKGQRSGEGVFELKNETRIDYDIESNPLKVIDARGNVVMCWKYNMLGRQVYQQSMDAGDRWMLLDAMQRELRKWDSRDHMTFHYFDELHRPWKNEVTNLSTLITKTYETYKYGESVPNAELSNLRGQLYQLYDTAGLVQINAYDNKGNVINTQRQLTEKYDEIPDWPTSSLEPDIYISLSNYDALNRPTQSITPDDSIHISVYNEAGLLNEIKVKIKNKGATKSLVRNIDYNAKGQREKIKYGNNSITTYEYNPKDYRLTSLVTKRSNAFLQDLNYIYDPVGNITQIYDNAQKTKFYSGQKIEQKNNYTYDALYQLIEANGREHIGQLNHNSSDNWDDSWCSKPFPSGNNDLAMRLYNQKYQYDAVGNIMQMKHKADSNSWTRNYQYSSNNNQLIKTTVGNAVNYQHAYSYNEHGSIQQLSHMSAPIAWNFREEMHYVDLGGGGKAYYQYDSNGQRVRKAIISNQGIIEETKYLDGIEIFQKRTQAGIVKLERENLSIHDDQGRIALIETKVIEDEIAISPIIPLIRYQYTNHLSTATLELDEVGNPITYEEYHPFGTSSYRAVDTTIQRAAKRYRYTGKERDIETGLYYHGARYYISWLGRWLKADPGGLIDGVNIFRYSSNSPIRFIDKTGKYTVEEGEGNHVVITDPKTHLAVEGDTYSGLSKKYGVSVEKLRDLNSYSDTSIPIGANLVISDSQEYIINSVTALDESVQNVSITQEVDGYRYEVDFIIKSGNAEGEISIQMGFDSDNYDAYIKAGLRGNIYAQDLTEKLNFDETGVKLSVFAEAKLGIETPYFTSSATYSLSREVYNSNGTNDEWISSFDIDQYYRFKKPGIVGERKGFGERSSSTYAKVDFGLKVHPVRYDNVGGYSFSATGQLNVEGKKQQLIYAPLAIFFVSSAKINAEIGINITKTKIVE